MLFKVGIPLALAGLALAAHNVRFTAFLENILQLSGY